MTQDFPRITKWRSESDLDENHAAYDFKLSDPIAPAFEFFLGLEGVPGYEEKLAEIRTRCTGPPNRNKHLVHWAAFCAELGAIYLLGGQLGLRILGLDRSSPRAPTRNCDVMAEVEGRPKYFEVKRRATEDLQIPPPLLSQRVSQLRLPYKLAIELHDSQYDCQDLETQLEKLREHLDFFDRHEDRDLWLQGDTVPPAFDAPGFSLWFHEGDPEGDIAEHFEPMTGPELRSWLLEEGRPGRDGVPMVPKVRQAYDQGADYLISRLEPGGSWSAFVEEIFPNARPIGTGAFLVDDPALAGLQGIILFSKYDSFCIINSAAADYALL